MLLLSSHQDRSFNLTCILYRLAVMLSLESQESAGAEVKHLLTLFYCAVFAHIARTLNSARERLLSGLSPCLAGDEWAGRS